MCCFVVLSFVAYCLLLIVVECCRCCCVLLIVVLVDVVVVDSCFLFFCFLFLFLLLLLLLDSKLGCGLYVLSGYFVLRQHSLDSGFRCKFLCNG